MGEVYHLYKLASRIPDIPLEFWNFMINKTFLSQNMRFTLLSAISNGDIDINNDFKGLSTYRRNIKHIIDICRANDIYVILSTFCHYLHSEVKDDMEYLKYHEGVKLANEIIRELASKYNLPLVENDILVQRENKYFVDTVHFTPEGMQLLAKNISQPIIEYIINAERCSV